MNDSSTITNNDSSGNNDGGADTGAQDDRLTSQNPQQPDTVRPKSELREQMQNEIVSLITQGLEDGTMSEERAREIAKVVLEKMPEDISHDELMKVIPKLDDEFKELSDIVIPIMVDYEAKIRTAVEAKVIKLIRERKFQEALNLARQGIDYTSKYVKGEV